MFQRKKYQLLFYYYFIQLYKYFYTAKKKVFVYSRKIISFEQQHFNGFKNSP